MHNRTVKVPHRVRKMTTKDAVECVMLEHKLSPYMLHKALEVSCPRCITNWRTGIRMHKKTAKLFLKLYGVEISDAYGAS